MSSVAGVTMMQQHAMGSLSRFIDHIEEAGIALCLGLMTLITFANVIARYVFADNILWALEVTVFLFAWLVLMGMSYSVKKRLHIGVDVVLNMVPPPVRRVLGLVSAAACIAFAVLMLIGAWEYWWPFATERAWYETENTPMPPWLQFLADWMNEGERYEKIPRWIPYLALPLGFALLTLRFVQQAWRIVRGETDRLISGHETGAPAQLTGDADKRG